MTAKNVNKNVETVIEDIRNFDRQVDSSWNPTIETKKNIFQQLEDHLSKYQLIMITIKKED